MRKPTKPIPSISRSTTFLLLFLSMATLLSLSLFLLLSLPSSHSLPSPLIQQACNATRFPLQCHSTLVNPLTSSPPSTPLQLISTATSASIHNLHTAQSMLHSLLSASDNLNSSSSSHKLATAATTCLQILRYSYHRTALAAAALPLKTKDARAWMSAALAYQYGCWSGLKNANDTVLVSKTMSFLDNLISLTSNALSMIVNYDMHGNDTVSWTPPRTERDGVWEKGLGSAGPEFRGGLPAGLKADVVVCKELGKGCYGTVQEAVNAAPDREEGGGGWFVIHIKEGVYEERVRVPLTKRNVVFLGDGMGKTVITGSASVGLQPGMTTYNSATVGVIGDGFMAKDLTIQNTAGPDAHQAVAFRSDSDLSVIENCEFISNQDTLYAHSLRQFYKSCRIIGNVDFIFGNSASIFQDCQILVQARQGRSEKGENNAITAHGRTDPAQSTGFVFHNCLVNGTEEYMALYYSKPKVHKNYLGRPWKEYSRTIFIHSFLESLIMPQGWMPWSADGFALKTLYYGEFENSGPGSNLIGRVPWSSKVPAEHVFSYSVQNFIQGNDWIPSSQ